LIGIGIGSLLDGIYGIVALAEHADVSFS